MKAFALFATVALATAGASLREARSAALATVHASPSVATRAVESAPEPEALHVAPIGAHHAIFGGVPSLAAQVEDRQAAPRADEDDRDSEGDIPDEDDRCPAHPAPDEDGCPETVD